MWEEFFRLSGSFIIIFLIFFSLTAIITHFWGKWKIEESLSLGMGLGFFGVGLYFAEIARRYFTKDVVQIIPFTGKSDEIYLISQNTSFNGSLVTNFNNTAPFMENDTAIKGMINFMLTNNGTFFGNITYTQDSFPIFMAVASFSIAIIAIGLAYTFDVFNRVNTRKIQEDQLELHKHEINTQQNLFLEIQQRRDVAEETKETEEYIHKYFKILKKL